MGAEHDPFHRDSNQPHKTPDFAAHLPLVPPELDALPAKSPYTGLPDLDRFPATFGYPPISGGSGRDEQEGGSPSDALPYGSMPLEELGALTRTWTEPIKRMVIDTRLMSSERRAGLERVILADIAFIAAERVRRLGLTPGERAQEN